MKLADQKKGRKFMDVPQRHERAYKIFRRGVPGDNGGGISRRGKIVQQIKRKCN